MSGKMVQDPAKRKALSDMLLCVGLGDAQKAFELMQIASANGMGFEEIRQGLYVMALLRDFRHDPGYEDKLTDAQWASIREEFDVCISFQEISGVFVRWSERASWNGRTF